MKVGISGSHAFATVRLDMTKTITALVFLAVLGKGQAQGVMDLPGMPVVAMHHGLDEVTLQSTWKEHVREAVLVSKGWAWVASVKKGTESAQTQPMACDDIEQLLLAGDIKHAETTTFYPCASGGFVQLVPIDFLDKLEARYLINANAKLNR